VVARFLTLKLTLMGNTFRKSVWQTIGMIVAALYALGVVGILITLVGALAFAGAGFRAAPVRFFPPDQHAEARAWLAA